MELERTGYWYCKRCGYRSVRPLAYTACPRCWYQRCYPLTWVDDTPESAEGDG